jgi:hypothetical protein
MIPALATRGLGWGSGLIDPAGHCFVVNIPKNASSYLHDWAKHHGWRTTIAQNETTVQEMIVILRDPVERWISGISQYIMTYILNVYGFNGPIFPGELVTEHDRSVSAEEFLANYNLAVERLLFDVVSRFDDHVWPQNEIIHNVLPTVPRRYFSINQINQELAEYLGWQPANDLDKNSGRDHDSIRLLQDFFHNRIHSQRPELLGRIQKHYHADYLLLNNLQQ